MGQYEIMDVSPTGDRMIGDEQQCVDFLALCRGLHEDQARGILMLAKIAEEHEESTLELVVTWMAP